MKLPFFCVMVSLSINAGAVIDGTVWEGDHGIFPITNAIALVNRKMRARHVDKVIYAGIEAHKVGGRHYWAGNILTDTCHGDYKAQIFKAYRGGFVEFYENNNNYWHDPKNRYPSYSIDRVLELYRRSGGDINYISRVGCDEYPTNAVWVIRALDNWFLIDELSPSEVRRFPLTTPKKSEKSGDKKSKEHESQTNRDVIRTAGRARGDPSARVLLDKEVSRNAKEIWDQNSEKSGDNP